MPLDFQIERDDSKDASAELTAEIVENGTSLKNLDEELCLDIDKKS